MASTIFTDQATVVYSSWLNDVNNVTYTTVPNLAVKGNNTDITSLSNVTVPTQTAGNSSGLIANTAFVTTAVASGSGSSSGATGTGNDKVFVENENYVTSNYTIGARGLTNCTISIASPAVVTQANTYVGGEGVFFQTNGSLPTGLGINTGYYVSTAGLNTSVFQVAATRGGVSLNTSGTQSGVHTSGKLKNATLTGPLTVATNMSVTVPSGARMVVL